MIDTRVADLRFVLDALGLERVGVYGHSAGGTAAARALHEDRRIAAAVYLAGTGGFRNARLDRSRAVLLAHAGPVARRQLDDTQHWVFTDHTPSSRSSVRALVRSFFAHHLSR